jgi:F-type H+-transporting ATPase subunit delta
MSVQRIATRYAKSLLDLSLEKDILESVKDDMVLFNKVCLQNNDFVLLLKNPIVPNSTKGKVMKEIFSGKVQELTEKFLDIVLRKDRESYLPEIGREFIAQYNAHNNVVRADVTTTIELTDDLRSEVSKVVNNISGKKVDLVETVDESIIGGIIIKVGDKQIDASVSSKLNALKRDLTKNQYVKQI